MPDDTRSAPVLLVGAGNLGGAILTGWLKARPQAAAHILVRARTVTAAASEAAAAGVVLNPPDAALELVRTVVFAVKPQGWRAAAAALAPLLADDAVIVSVMAGPKLAAVSEAFGGRRVARAMPTTAVGMANGVATLVANDPVALARAHALFDPIATTVELDDEAMIDAAIGVSGSAPAYLYAFTEALAAAGEKAGLPAALSGKLARATLESAAALMAQSPLQPSELRRQVASPRGTTEAALDVLLAPQGLPLLLRQAVQAAADRSRALAAEAGGGGLNGFAPARP